MGSPSIVPSLVGDQKVVVLCTRRGVFAKGGGALPFFFANEIQHAVYVLSVIRCAAVPVPAYHHCSMKRNMCFLLRTAPEFIRIKRLRCQINYCPEREVSNVAHSVEERGYTSLGVP